VDPPSERQLLVLACKSFGRFDRMAGLPTPG